VKLSDIMSSMQLSSYAEVALVLFLGAFAAITLSLFWSRKREEWERYGHLPLDETDITLPSTDSKISPAHRAHQP
jgi:cbb3-type cytochrome oxidase subunit 3